MKALCVIDVQVDYTDRPGKNALARKTVDSLISNINHFVDQAVALGIPVIYIRHVNSTGIAQLLSRILGDGLAMPGTNGIELNSRLKVVSQNIFDKGNLSAFSSADFTNYLKTTGIKHLCLAGLDGCSDVAATAKSAKERGFEVTLLSSAIASTKPTKWNMTMATIIASGVKSGMTLG